MRTMTISATSSISEQHASVAAVVNSQAVIRDDRRWTRMMRRYDDDGRSRRERQRDRPPSRTSRHSVADHRRSPPRSDYRRASVNSERHSDDHKPVVKHERVTIKSEPLIASGRPSDDDRDVGEDPNSVDRDWYDADENGAIVDSTAFTPPPVARKPKLTIRAIQAQAENRKWEQVQSLRHGTGGGRGGDGREPLTLDNLSSHEDVESKVELLVHDSQPPFLDGRTVYSKQQSLVSIVKDSTSDFAVIARKGSPLLASIRENVDRNQNKEKFWEIAGNKIGSVMGVTQSATDSDRAGDSGENDSANTNYKQSSQFAAHIQSKPTAAQSDFSATKSIAQQREYLPVFQCRSELMRVIHDNPVTIIVGETGSGKTTQLTQYLLEDGYADNGTGVIGCTQPRRVAAMSVAKRVSEERGTALGTEVGYTIRFEDLSSRDTKILYMTEGVLLRESLTSSDLDRYSVIVMDEAHERSLNTDVLFGLFKSLLRRRNDLKLIVTSATMDADRFSLYFGGAPVFNIPGRVFPVDVLYSKSPCEDYLDSAIKQILTVHLSQPIGDILVFLSGQEDIECCVIELSQRIEQLGGECPPLTVLPLYSQLPADLQSKIFEPTADGSRKCVIATNVAETSLTIDGIRYVIDSGYSKVKIYNPRVGMDSLILCPISRASANQRAGRAGRTGPGHCFRLYTEQQFMNEMLPAAIPEIQRTNLSSIVLLLKSLGVDNLLAFEFLDSPPQETIVQSLYQLWMLGALDDAGALSALGRRMVEFPLDPPLAKLILTAESLRCTSEAITIVAMLSMPNIFHRPRDRLEESEQAREKFLVSESDHLTLLNIYQQWAKHHYSNEFCKQHFLQYKALRKIKEVRAQLHEILGELRIGVSSASADWDVVRQCVCAAYFYHSAKLKTIDVYSDLRTNLAGHLHPHSALTLSAMTPDYIVYHELLMTHKEYLRIVTSVSAEWLAQYGSMFFTIKEQGSRRQRQLQKQYSETSEADAAKKQPVVAPRERASKAPVVEIGEADKESRLERERKRRRMRLGGM